MSEGTVTTPETTAEAESLRRATMLAATHEIKNILTIVLMGIDALTQRAGMTDDERALAMDIRKAAIRGVATVRAVATLERTESAETKCALVHEAISRTLPLIQAATQRNTRIRLFQRCPEVRVKLSETELGQIVTNLVLNAMDAMPDGGEVELSTAHFSRDAREFVELSVSDTGHGMDEETIAKLFQPFFTTKNIPGAIGLGLTIVKDIVDRAGGGIGVQSTTGAGTAFRVLLPIELQNIKSIRSRSIW